MLNKIINRFNLTSKKLFLIDVIGAMVSVFMLGVVLVKFESFFGIPKSTLYFLAFLPFCFAIYDLVCFQFEDDKSKYFLKGIAILNMVYCCLSLGVAIYHYGQVTVFGWLYILIEILIVLILASLELRVASNYDFDKQDF